MVRKEEDLLWNSIYQLTVSAYSAILLDKINIDALIERSLNPSVFSAHVF